LSCRCNFGSVAAASLPASLLDMLPLLLTAAGLTVVACWPLRAIALRFGVLDRPAQRKSHPEPTPYLGGVGIWLGTLAALTLFRSETRRPSLLAAAVALGVADDLLGISVSRKLIAETALAGFAVALGVAWQVTDSPLLNGAVSLLWIVGLTNAFNLLDNMDGLAATVAAPGLMVLAVIDPADAPFTLALAGAVVGFLTLNWPPATMFMGDAGSLMIGFGLGLATIAAANHAHGLHSLVFMVGPVLVALFDTLLVIVSRLLSGRPIQLGGTDHFSHRLRLQGWSRRQVLAGSAITATLGGVATYLAATYPVAIAWLAVPLLVAGAAAWFWLLKVDPYGWEKPVVAEVSSA
jgi:UDP-GlcNAc:undecaprenyl-phosphate/decaprenyl-phosphate GlcNAc-1-phosphate transferase